MLNAEAGWSDHRVVFGVEEFGQRSVYLGIWKDHFVAIDIYHDSVVFQQGTLQLADCLSPRFVVETGAPERQDGDAVRSGRAAIVRTMVENNQHGIGALTAIMTRPDREIGLLIVDHGHD